MIPSQANAKRTSLVSVGQDPPAATKISQVIIVDLVGLPSQAISGDLFFACQVVNKLDTVFKTEAIQISSSLVWNHVQELGEISLNDALEFTLFEYDESLGLTSSVGTATLQGSAFFRNGFSGSIDLIAPSMSIDEAPKLNVKINVRKHARHRLREAERTGSTAASMSYKTNLVNNPAGRGASKANRTSATDDISLGLLPSWVTDFGVVGTNESSEAQDDGWLSGLGLSFVGGGISSSETREDDWWSGFGQGRIVQGIQDLTGAAQDEESDAEEVTWNEERDMMLGKSQTHASDSSSKQLGSSSKPRSSVVTSAVKAFEKQKDNAMQHERHNIKLEEQDLLRRMQEQELEMYALAAVDQVRLLLHAREVRRATHRATRERQDAKDRDARSWRILQGKSLVARVRVPAQVVDATLARCVEAAQSALNAERAHLEMILSTGSPLDVSGKAEKVRKRAEWGLQHEYQAALRAVADCSDFFNDQKTPEKRSQLLSLEHPRNDFRLKTEEMRNASAKQYLVMLDSQAPAGTAIVQTVEGMAYAQWSHLQ